MDKGDIIDDINAARDGIETMRCKHGPTPELNAALRLLVEALEAMSRYTAHPPESQ